MLVRKDVQRYLLNLLKIEILLKGQRRQNLIQVFSKVLTKDVLKVIRVFQPLEKHLSFGKCEMRVERATLLDPARQMYHAKLTEGRSKDVRSHCAEASVRESAVNTSQNVKGWALRQTKKSG